MVNITCTDAAFASSQDCRGNGLCEEVLAPSGNQTYMCNCSDGWTGRSDWINIEDYGGGNCHLNETGLMICWLLLCIVNTIAFNAYSEYI